MYKTFEIPIGNGQYKTVTAKNKSQALGMTVASGVKPKLNKLSVTGYTDNPDGTTTNFLNDGTQETGTYTTNKNKSLTFNPTITADNLTPTNTPVIPPVVNTQTAKNNLNSTLATLTPTAEEISQANAENLAKANRPIDTTTSRIKDIAGIQAGQGADVQKYSETVGTVEANKALNESNKALLRLDASYKEQVDKIKANAEGKFGGAVQQDLNDAERSYTDTKYKLNIDKLVAQGDVNTAKGLVDQYIAYKYEPLENELKTLTTLYGLYQNDMTESEKLTAQQAYQEKADKIAFNQQKELLDYKAKIDEQADYRNASLKAQELASSGLYTTKQLTALTRLNENISKSETYKKTNNMRGYVDNVSASLSQASGAGDLAAINQFQKVIDEGAVTRDQDVKLIQSSQSLANRLQTYGAKLAKGEQLSPALRTEMRTAVQKLYDAQVKALAKDPYVQSKTREATLYGLDPIDTIIGELGAFSGEVDTNPFSSALGGSTLEEFTIYNPSQGFIIPQN